MKKSNKKGFTIVELIVVIATLAILAAILIPTFAGIIKKANDSAYQQERTNQMIQDAVEKIEKGDDNYMSWEDVEKAIAEALKESTLTADNIIKIVGVGKDTGLTAEQLTAILEAIANKKFSDTQVKVILEKEDINPSVIDQIIAKLPQVGITQEDIAAAVSEVITDDKLAEKINKAIEDAIANIPALNEGGIAAIVEQILNSITVFADVAVIKSGEETKLMTLVEFANAVNAGNSYDDYTIELLDDIDLIGVEWTPINGFSGTFDGNYKKIKNLTVESNVNKADLGLFALTETAEIKNLTLSNFKIRDTGSSKSANAGALVGTAKNGLSLSNINVDSSTEITGKKIGGLVGNVVCSKASQYLFNNCHSSATVIGERCGGIVGQINPDKSGYVNNFGFDIFTSCSFDGTLNANTGSNPMSGGIVAQYTAGNPQYLTHGFYNCSVNDTNISSNASRGSFVGFSQSGLSFFSCKLNGTDITLPSALSSGRGSHQSFSINGVVYIVSVSADYANITASAYDSAYTATVKSDQQADKFYVNGEEVSRQQQVWYKVTNLYVDMEGNAIFSSDSSVVFKGSMPTSLEEGTKLQRCTYVAGYDYSARQYTYGFDMWRIVSNDTEAEGSWQDVDNDGSTGFVLGAGIYYYLDPTPFIDAQLYEVSSRETTDGWMIYTVTAK